MGDQDQCAHKTGGDERAWREQAVRRAERYRRGEGDGPDGRVLAALEARLRGLRRGSMRRRLTDVGDLPID